MFTTLFHAASGTYVHHRVYSVWLENLFLQVYNCTVNVYATHTESSVTKKVDSCSDTAVEQHFDKVKTERK